MRKTLKHKALSAIMAVLMILPTLFAFPVTALAATPVSYPGDVSVKSIQAGQTLVKFDGDVYDDFCFDYIAYEKDGKTWPAYCLEPNKPGVEQVGAYTVGALSLIDNVKVYGAITNGYPFKTPAEMGVNSAYEAYYVTKLAIWSLVHANYSNPDDFTPNGSANAHIITAFKALRTKAAATTSIGSGDVTLAANPEGDVSKSGDNNVQVFSVTPGSIPYTIAINGSAPSGAIVTDTNGVVKTSFAAGENFAVSIPIASITANGSFGLTLTATSGSGTATVFDGQSKSSVHQDYALTYEAAIAGSGTVSYNKDDAPPPTETAPTPPGDGSLRIVKLEAGTTKPLAGAEFCVTKADGGVVGHYFSDANGQANIPNLASGTYYVDEVTPPKGYIIDATSHKDVVIVADRQAVLTFENASAPKVKIYKLDADTSEPIADTVFEVALDGGSEKYVARANGVGEASLGDAVDLKPGTYTVKEISVPEPYLLDPSDCSKIVKLVAGQTASVTFKNQKKPGIIIRKYIEGTSILLDGAEFSVAKKGGSIVWEGIAENGVHFLENLAPGWFSITELAPPDGFMITTVSKDVYLEPGKTVEVKFDNRPRPKLEIVKLDQDGKPLPGAVFRVRKAEAQTVTDVTTDAGGRVRLDNLDEAVYVVDEITPPNGYTLAADSHREILTEWGKTKTLTFVNARKPSLEILKVDEETKKPLAGAKFRIVRTEGNTVREEITDAQGKIILTDLEVGIYGIEEIVAPSGYLLESQHKDVELLPGDGKQVIFTNKARPKLRILKVDVVTGEPLKNAEFRVMKAEDKTVLEYITNETGEILIENLDEAIYTATEFMPPSGYILLDEAKQIALEWGKTKVLKFDNIRKPTLIFTKLNGLTNKPIAGAVFKVEYEQQSGGVAPLGTFRTNEDGKIVIPQVNPGWFILTETQPAPGFSLPSNPVTRLYLSPGQNAYPVESGAMTAFSGDIAATGGGEYVTGVDNEGQLVYNWPLNSVIIKKTDANTGELLAGAAFELYRADEQVSGVPGTAIGRYTTDHSGVIVITGLESGFYAVKEVQAPPNYLISENSQQNGFLKADGTTVLEFAFANIPYGSILVTKVDGQTHKPLPGARFKVTDGSGAVAGNTNGEYVTDVNGEFLVPNLKPGAFIVKEIEAPPNYAVNGTPQTVQIGTDGKTYKVTFANCPFGSLLVKKVDAQTNAPLMGARFKVTDSAGAAAGNSNGEFVTDANGEFVIANLKPAAYIVTELAAPSGYALDGEPRTINVGADGKAYTLTFADQPLATLVIKKYNEATREPLPGAEFMITTAAGNVVGNSNGLYTTDAAGTIQIPNLDKGSYIVKETKAPTGFILENQTRTIAVDYGKAYALEFTNKPKSGLRIIKLDAATGTPLAGAKFAVEKQNGERVGEYTSDVQGIITIPNLAPGFYLVREVSAPDGYWLDESPKTVEVKTNAPTIVTFSNKRLASLQIKKVDEATGTPLAGAIFTIERQNGEKVFAHENGLEWTTDAQGFISVPAIAPGFYVVRELKAPTNYILDETPRTVEVKTETPTAVTFGNKALSGLKIVKLNSHTREPIAGVEFSISKMNGEKIENDFRQYIFKTDKVGQIYVPSLADGYYLVTETKAADGYFLDAEPKTVLVQSGKTTLLEVLNTPMSGLLIVKRDEKTGQPLQGVVFDVRRADGQFVTGNILDKNLPNTAANSPNKTTSPNRDVTGSYTTDAQGRILINGLGTGEYHVTERKALDGYELDAEVHAVTVTAGKLATLQLTNRQKAGLRLIKIDSISKKPIYNVEFCLFDQSGKALGNFYTDNNGVIDFSGILSEGRYTLRETRPAPGYYADDAPRTVVFKSGEYTEIRWENVPRLGQIQLLKKSADANEINGFEAGTPLAGAVFEVSDYKTGSVVDRFISGNDGRAVSKPLPLGRYLVRETQAPQYYKLSDKTLDIEIEFPKQIIKLDFLNFSANTGVNIRKVGNVEAMPGTEIRYDIKEVRNTSTVSLTDFYWRDVLPVNVVRLTKIVTGTYAQSLKYKILITTNRGDTRVIADNLSTTRNNVIDCSAASLGLHGDEFVTSFTLVFGTVKAGFCQVEEPKVFVKVLTNLPNGFEFANKADVAGKYGLEWVAGNTAWRTVIFRPIPSEPLPRTGY